MKVNRIVVLGALFILMPMIILGEKDWSYAKNGVWMKCSDEYTLQENRLKYGEKVFFSGKGRNITLLIMDNRLAENFDKLVVEQIVQKYTDKGYKNINVNRIEEKLPVNIKGSSKKEDVPLVRRFLTATVDVNNKTLNLEQDMYFFSHGIRGYVMYFTSVVGEFPGKKDVLSSLTLVSEPESK